MLNVRQGTIGDLPMILDFIDEASRWLQSKGTDQWARPWPTKQDRDERVRSGLADGRTWIVDDARGVSIATITCRPAANPALWNTEEQVQPAVYVSRLIVRRAHAGRAIGNELLNWAGRRAAEQYGAQWIRLDVWLTNVALHGYYEKRGFEFVRFCDDSGYPSAALFQKATADINDADIPRLRQVTESRSSGLWGWLAGSLLARSSRIRL